MCTLRVPGFDRFWRLHPASMPQCVRFVSHDSVKSGVYIQPQCHNAYASQRKTFTLTENPDIKSPAAQPNLNCIAGDFTIFTTILSHQYIRSPGRSPTGRCLRHGLRSSPDISRSSAHPRIRPRQWFRLSKQPPDHLLPG